MDDGAKDKGSSQKDAHRGLILGEHQLVCELCDVVLEANLEDKWAHIVKAHSLEYRAYASGNSNRFGFYCSTASLECQAAGVKAE